MSIITLCLHVVMWYHVLLSNNKINTATKFHVFAFNTNNRQLYGFTKLFLLIIILFALSYIVSGIHI